MEMHKTKVDEVKRVISYTETLRDIPVGITRSFEMIGMLPQGMYNAKARLAAKGYAFDFSKDRDKNLLVVTRIA